MSSFSKFLSGVSRTNSVRPSNESRSETSQSNKPGSKKHAAIMKSWVSRGRRDTTTTLPKSFTAEKPPVVISPLAKAFVDSLNSAKLCNFLIWILYYDIVQLPDSPDAWYSNVNNMDIRGWIALGKYLSKTSHAMDTGSEFDLVVLSSICDRLQIQRSTVHALLIQFFDPAKMEYSQVATIVNDAIECGTDMLETFEMIQAKLHEMNKLVRKLKPTEQTVYEEWQATIMKRITDLLNLVIAPRISNLRLGTPIITAATSELLPQHIKDGIALNYQFEALQPKRSVPLHRYGIYPDMLLAAPKTPPPPRPSTADPATPQKNTTNHTQDFAVKLMDENRKLRAEVAALKTDKEKLQSLNNDLVLKTSTMSRLEQMDSNQGLRIRLSPPRSEDAHGGNAHLTYPATQHEPPFSELQRRYNAQLLHQHRMTQHYVTPYGEQEDVFTTPSKLPVRSLRTSPLKQVHTAESTLRRTARGRDVSRRSGMVFNEKHMSMLAAMREGDSKITGDEE